MASLRVDMGQAKRLIARVDTLAQGPLGTQAVEASARASGRASEHMPATQFEVAKRELQEGLRSEINYRYKDVLHV